ncbi:MAG: hypothetical protein EBZ13_06380 [Planctomycetia bacterium]|jgi:hypothetical protein|nr:hypothetical protein [Planctomycetia bacterium]
MPRFVLLEHTGHPDDPAGRHYDLLLETAEACRTWRLAEIPAAGGPPVAATPLPDHRLVWLDRLEGEVSGGRGFARRVDAGAYEWLADEPLESRIEVRLQGETLNGRLTIAADLAKLGG